jgi:hypothetical protein
MTDARCKLRSLGWLALGLAALLNAGCLVAAVGAAGAGAAAAGYTWYNGVLYRDYSANVADTLSAVRVSLQELQFPIVEEKNDTGSAFVKTRTADGHTVRIFLDIVASPIPAEGALTRVGVRVGFSGDEGVSARILDQVSRHLVARPMPAPVAVPGAPPGPPPASPTLLPPRPIPVVETSPPPLAVVPAAGSSPR